MSQSPVGLGAVTLPAGWEAVYAASQPEGFKSLTPEERAYWESVAAEYLWRWTGGRFGLAEVTLIPCFRTQRPSTFKGMGPYTSERYLYAYGLGARLLCVTCGRACRCAGGFYGIVLPGPVHEVRKVTLDGEELPASSWTLRDGGNLVRIDGKRWPFIRSLTPRQEEEGLGWQISYVRGEPLPNPGAVALGILAIEFWKGYAGDRSCQLPERLTSVTREGVTVTVLDTFDDLDSGHTGIWLVDSWVASVIRTPLPTVIDSPDMHRPRFL